MSSFVIAARKARSASYSTVSLPGERREAPSSRLKTRQSMVRFAKDKLSVGFFCRGSPWMRGSSPRMTLSMLSARALPPIHESNSQASSPVFFKAPGAPVFSCPSKREGAERRKTHPFQTSRRADKFTQVRANRLLGVRAHRGQACAVRASNNPRRAHASRRSTCGDFAPRDRASCTRADRSSRPQSGGFRLLRPAQSSHRRQPHVVGADGDPRRPGREVTSPVRGRRTPLRRRNVSRRRPQASGVCGI
jgi:hypothetical protein